MINKDDSITQLGLKTQEDGVDTHTANYWEGDSFAVGSTGPHDKQSIVYASTFNTLDELYNYEFETRPKQASVPFFGGRAGRTNRL